MGERILVEEETIRREEREIKRVLTKWCRLLFSCWVSGRLGLRPECYILPSSKSVSTSSKVYTLIRHIHPMPILILDHFLNLMF